MAENTCAQCGRTGVSLMRCTGCKVTYFCDRNCQTLGWKDHKKACKELAKANEAPPAPAPEALAASGAPQKAAPGTSKIQLTMQEGTAFIQENKFQEALAKFTECFELTKDTNLTEPHAICIYFMAVANSKMRQMVAAKKLLEEFFETEFCKTAEPDENPIPQKAYSLGIDVYLMLGDTEGALRCGAEGERLAKESGRRADHCELLLKLGRLNYQIADFETAASTLEQARALAAMLQGSYAQLYQERYGEAIECFEGELNVAKEMGGSIAKQIPKAHANLVAAYLKSGDEDNVEKHTKLALDKAQSSMYYGGAQMHAMVLGQLGDAFRETAPARWVDMQRALVAVAEESGDEDSVADAEELLVEALRGAGQHPEADALEEKLKAMGPRGGDHDHGHVHGPGCSHDHHHH